MSLGQINIARYPIRLQNVLSLQQNLPFYRLLSSIEDGFINDPTKNYRVGLIIIELLKYIKAKKLFQFPSTIICDEELRNALGLRTFQIKQLGEVVHTATTLGFTPTFEAHEEFVLQTMERATILKLILELSTDEPY